jgi:hypothetical protein
MRMSLYPGSPHLDASGNHVLDDTALVGSMAQAMEDEMAHVYEQVKGSSLPLVGKDDRRLLFVAISRGILRYLNQHGEAIRAISGVDASAHVHDVRLNITMDAHVGHG